MITLRFTIITSVLLAFAICASAHTLTGKVVSVTDGDGIIVLDAENTQHKIRLNGIDAPERAQAFGQAAKRNLSALVFGKMVRVEWSKFDRYKRKVGLVFIGETNVNLEQLRGGFAWYFAKYERDVPSELREPFADAERESREMRRGLWVDDAPIAPWDWRANKYNLAQ